MFWSLRARAFDSYPRRASPRKVFFSHYVSLLSDGCRNDDDSSLVAQPAARAVRGGAKFAADEMEVNTLVNITDGKRARSRNTHPGDALPRDG